MSQDWYYCQNGGQFGPVSEAVVREMLQSGRLGWDELVWHDGLPDWVSAEEIPVLASSRVRATPGPAFVSPVPAPPPLAPPPPASVMTAAAAYPAQAAAIATQPLSAIRPLSPSAPAAPMFGQVSESAIAILATTRPWVRLLGILAFIGCVLMLLFGLGGLVMGIIGGGGGLAGVGIGLVAMLVYLVAAGFILPVALFLNRYAKAVRPLQASRRSEDLERALLAQKSFWKYVGILTLVGIAISLLATVGTLIFGLSGYLTSSF